jgi:hypothetical protein
MIYLIIIVCLSWGAVLGYIWFQLLHMQTRKALSKGVAAMSSPLRTMGAVILMCAPVLLTLWDRYYGVYGIISSFAGFAIGSGLWWLIYIRKNKDGGN